MSRKNSFQSSFILLGVSVAVLLFSIFFLKPRMADKKVQEEQQSLLLPEWNWEEIEAVEVYSSKTKERFSIKKGSKEWFLEDGKKNQYFAERSLVEGFLKSLLNTQRETHEFNADDKQQGFEEVSYELKLKRKDSSERVLKVGNDTPINYFSYARWASQPEKTFLVSRSLRLSLGKEIKDFRDKIVIVNPFNALKSIEFRSRKADLLENRNFQFIASEQKTWSSLKPLKVRLQKGALKKWYEIIANTKVQNFVSEDPKHRRQLGFSRPLLTFVIQDQKGNKQEWQLSSQRKKQGGSNRVVYYWAEKNSDSTYEVSAAFVRNFNRELYFFRPKNLASLNPAEVEEIRIENGKDSVVLTKKDSSWEGVSSFKNYSSGKVKTKKVLKALDSLKDVKVTRYHDLSSSARLGLSARSQVISFKKANKLLLKVKLGKKLSKDERIVSSPSLDAPGSIMLDLEELFPLKAEHYFEKKSSSGGASSSTGSEIGKASKPSLKQKKGMKKMLEPTVSDVKEIKKLPEAITKKGMQYYANVEMENGTVFKFDFDAEKAPYTVSNFLHLARNGFYNGVKFHRVIANFVAQGGDPTGSGAGGPGWKFDNEDNDLKHLRGSLSMAHAGRDTNGSQFFVVLAPQPHLDGVHTVFGRVSEGLDKIDSIQPDDVMKKVEVFELAL